MTDYEPPLYQQIADDLRQQIKRGDLSPGDLIPSEAVLSERYDTTHMTARAGIRLLRDEGMARAEHGRGVFVAEPQLPFQVDGGKHVATLKDALERAEYKVSFSLPNGERVRLVKEYSDSWRDCWEQWVYRPMEDELNEGLAVMAFSKLVYLPK